VHPQLVQVDTRRPGAKLAAPLDDTNYLQISYSRKTGSVNVRTALEGIVHLRELGVYAKINLSVRRRV
jgi:hypothetical protein